MGKKKKTNKDPRKRITLRENTQLNQKIIDELEELFMFASPATLQKSVNYIFYQYLFFAEDVGGDTDFKHIAEDFYFLQRFFGEANEGFNVG
jgi:hypothetical protein